MARIKPEFERRNVKIIRLSVDPVDRHAQWASDIEDTQGHAPNYPLIGPDKKVKLILVYPMTTGRNFDEVLRVIDSLQLTPTTRSRPRSAGSPARR